MGESDRKLAENNDKRTDAKNKIKTHIRSRGRLALAMLAAVAGIFYILTLINANDIKISIRLSEPNDHTQFRLYYSDSEGNFEDFRSVDFECKNDMLYVGNAPRGYFGGVQTLKLDFDSRFLLDDIAVDSIVYRNPLRSTYSYKFTENVENIQTARDSELRVDGDTIYLSSTGPRSQVHFTNTDEIMREISSGISFNAVLGALITLAAICVIYIIPEKYTKRAAAWVHTALKEIPQQGVSLNLAAFILIALPVLVLWNSRYGGGYGVFTPFSQHMPVAVTVFFLILICMFFAAVVSKDAKRGKSSDSTLTLPGESMKHRWIYPALFLAVSSVIYFAAIIPNNNLFIDENRQFDAAAGYMYTGSFNRWNFLTETIGGSYTRASYHTALISLFYRIFGVSITTARAVSALAGVLTIVSSYFIFKKWFKNVGIAVLSSLILMLNYRYIENWGSFNNVRMYGSLVFLSLLLMHAVYCAFTYENKFKDKNRVTRFLNKYCIHIGYSLLTLLICVLLYKIMPNGLFILVGSAMTVFGFALFGDKSRFKALGLVGAGMVVILFAVIILYSMSSALQGISILRGTIGNLVRYATFENTYIDFFISNVDYPFGLIAGTVLTVLGIVCCFKKRNEGVIYTLLPLWQLTVLLLFVFVLDRYYQYRYMVFIYPATVCLQMLGLFYFLSTLKRNVSKCILVCICAVMPLQFVSHINKTTLIERNDRYKYNEALAYIDKHSRNLGLQDPVIMYAYNETYPQSLGIVSGNPDYIRATHNGNERYEGFALKRIEPDSEGYITFRGQYYQNGVSEQTKELLKNATDIVAFYNLDNYNVPTFKYTAISPLSVTNAERAFATPTFTISEYDEENHVYYIDIEISYVEEMFGCHFFTVSFDAEIKHLTERRSFQLFIPEEYIEYTGSTLVYRLPFASDYSQYAFEDFALDIQGYIYDIKDGTTEFNYGVSYETDGDDEEE